MLLPEEALVDDRAVQGPQVTPFDQDRRDQYLAFGFVAELTDTDPLALLGEWSRTPARDERSVSESRLVTEGVRALRAAFEGLAAQGLGRDQVVFLSGGLDSRAILGELLHAYGSDEVLAATFGLPGEQDFDFGSQVARVAGVRHERLESFSVDWTTESLVDSVLAREVPLPQPFGQRYLSYRLHDRIGPEHAFWDGLCGGSVSGVHAYTKGAPETWEAARDHFLQRHLVRGWEAFTTPGFQPQAALPASPLCSEEVLSYANQLEFAVRQGRYIATRRLRAYTVRTPYLAGPWLDFMLSVPPRYRYQQRLYQAIVQSAHPRLFSLPTTTFVGKGAASSPLGRRVRTLQRRVLLKARSRGLGRFLGGEAPGGANDAIRRAHQERPEIRDLVTANLDDLARRGLVPGVEVGATAAAAVKGRMGESRLSALLGAELNLKALERLDAGAAS